MLKGISLALASNLLFGMGYYFAVLLRPLSGEGMLGFRILVLLPIILFTLLLFKQQNDLRELFEKIKQAPYLIVIILLLTFNTGVQLWLFVWAPNNDQAIQVSIGYLLLPIVAAILGKIVFKEYFSTLKWWAFAIACLGVFTNVVLTNSISWATFVAGLGYPLYVTLRRYFHINNLATFFVELLLLLPVALYFLYQVDMQWTLQQNASIYFYLLLFGIVNGLAFIFYIYASNLLPINVLGLLGYIEPLVMLFISFAIGEILDTRSYLLMGCLTISIGLFTFDRFRRKKNVRY